MGLIKLQYMEDFKNTLVSDVCNWYAKHKISFWAAYGVTLIAYSYFFTQLAFSNHTFPMVWTYEFPSYRTLVEGRWFSDILIWVLGCVGVSSSQMFIATGLQIINAIVFAEVVGVKGRLSIFLACTLLSLYPAFCDRYIFPGSQIPYAITDSLAVLALLVLYRQKKSWKALVGASLLMFLCLASYQPEIGLISFLLLVYCILEVLRSESFPIKRLAIPAAALALASVGYYVTAKMTITQSGFRSHINSLSEVFQQVQGAYPTFVKYFTVGSDYLPASLRWLPLAVVILGSTSLILASWRKGMISVITVLVILGLMPIALRSTYIINDQTYKAGRIIFPYGYALLFFLLAMGMRARLRLISISVTLVFIYFFLIMATQETNAAYLKTMFDLNKINRIAERIESVVPDLYATKRPVVIVGYLRMENQKLKRYPNYGNSPHSNTESFETYRQAEILNFYFGRDVLVRPTIEQRDSVLPSMNGRRPWPAPESVYVNDNVVVILLEEYRHEVPITITQ